MHGDFSQWPVDVVENAVGPLHQQGRVLLDVDINALTTIITRWQDHAARAAFGQGVAAVSTETPDSFAITGATYDAAHDLAQVTLNAGELWADGLRVALPAAAGHSAVTLSATWDAASGSVTPAHGANGTRDAVVLEVWRQTLSAFQLPDPGLLEVALGGPDTTERLVTAAALRLHRLGAGDDCESVDLGADWATRGQLTVTFIQPPPDVANPDCPVLATGGYTGFEHDLYRIEVAPRTQPTDPAQLKWSRFNGGLVGRGVFATTGSVQTITITANQQAIVRSGLATTTPSAANCYVEVVEIDPAYGYARITYGATATLSSDAGTFTIVSARYGSFPSDGNARFIRIWNGILSVASFPVGAANQLVDGICLQLKAEDFVGTTYQPGDYWTFAVRAGQVTQPPMPTQARPEGIHYHRVPLGVINWNSPATFDDCREPFHPLTKISDCCTYDVGDGKTSHGDFTSIQAAVDKLPKSGGRICVLPGEYQENVELDGLVNVTIAGCSRQARVTAKSAQPVFLVQNSSRIRIEGLEIVADDSAAGVRVAAVVSRDRKRRGRVDNVMLRDLRIKAQAKSAIEVVDATRVFVRECRIDMRDGEFATAGIDMRAEKSAIERNVVRVTAERDEVVEQPLEAEPRSEIDRLPIESRAASRVGGIWLRGWCKEVRVVENLIVGGRGHGITLGSVDELDDKGKLFDGEVAYIFDDKKCGPCHPGTGQVPPPTTGGHTYRSTGPLRDIRIKCNRISGMGLAGIGAYGYFGAGSSQGIILVSGLQILGNTIERCLSRPLAAFAEEMKSRMGYGAIALSAVEDGVIRDNFIRDNGPSFIEPVCGIYVLEATGLEISRNQILNNGARSSFRSSDAKAGPRAAIYVQAALASLSASDAGDEVRIVSSGLPGLPALIVRDNVVSAPLGLALFVVAFGPVTVQNNQLASLGLAPRQLLSSLATTVLIIDLGVSPALEGESFGVAGMLAGATVMTTSEPKRAVDAELAVAQRGLVLFSGNQVLLESSTRAESAESAQSKDEQQQLSELRGGVVALSSVAIVTLDDVGVQTNQLDVRLSEGALLTNVAILAISARLDGNRLQENGQHALFSGFVLGDLLVVADNIASHCIFVDGLAVVKANNIELDRLRAPCEDRIAGKLQLFPSSSQRRFNETILQNRS